MAISYFLQFLLLFFRSKNDGKMLVYFCCCLTANHIWCLYYTGIMKCQVGYYKNISEDSNLTFSNSIWFNDVYTLADNCILDACNRMAGTDPSPVRSLGLECPSVAAVDTCLTPVKRTYNQQSSVVEPTVWDILDLETIILQSLIRQPNTTRNIFLPHINSGHRTLVTVNTALVNWRTSDSKSWIAHLSRKKSSSRARLYKACPLCPEHREGPAAHPHQWVTLALVALGSL